jgi:hypothetical protein
MSEDRILVAKAKVQRLLDANVIREVKYADWCWYLLTQTKYGRFCMRT